MLILQHKGMWFKLFLMTLIVSGFVSIIGYWQFGYSQAGQNSEKQIGTIDQFGNFIPQTQLSKDEKYWVRVRVNGKDISGGGGGGRGGNDIYLSLDVSTSMADFIPRGSGGQIRRYEAAKNAIRQFADLADGDNSNNTVDYLGFGTFDGCGRYTDAYTPIQWVYEDYFRFSDGSYRRLGRATSHFNLREMNTTGKTALKNTVQALTFGDHHSDDDEPVNPMYCTGGNSHGVGERGGTSVASGIALGNSYLTPIISSARRQYDNSLYSNSNLGITRNHPGPQARDMAGNDIKKYIILFSDGGESARPFLTDQDMDRSGRTIVQNSQRYNIKVYVISYADSGSSDYTKLANIANSTGGKVYSGTSESNIISAYNAIASEIRNNTISSKTTSATRVTETINGSNFVIDEPEINTSFKITRPGSGGAEQNITSTGCANLTCISNKQYSGGLKSFDVDLGDLGSTDTRYIYFRVTATTVGSNIKVDSDSSTLRYTDLNQSEQLDNINVNIINNKFYFTIDNGDIYSNAAGSESIKSTMRSGQVFTRAPHSVVVANGGLSFAQGSVGQSKFAVTSYADRTRLTYADFYKAYSGNLVRRSLNGFSDMATSGYYLDTSTLQSGNTMILAGNGWRNQVVTNKNLVVFVPGDLFIREPFSVAKNGTSSVTFIVNGNVGINTSVGNLDAIIIADGVIDTACNQTNGFTISNPCSPGMEENTTKLTFQGMMYAGGGVLLDRGGVSTDPGWGEAFVYRPDMMLSVSQSLGNIVYSWKETKD